MGCKHESLIYFEYGRSCGNCGHTWFNQSTSALDPMIQTLPNKIIIEEYQKQMDGPSKPTFDSVDIKIQERIDAIRQARELLSEIFKDDEGEYKSNEYESLYARLRGQEEGLKYALWVVKES